MRWRSARGVLAEYGGVAAQPRIATVLRRASKQMTGSRTGSAAGRNLEIWIPGASGAGEGANFFIISGASFYDPQFWASEKYQAWHDAMWEWSEGNTGRVRASELQPVREPAPVADDDGD